MYYPCSENKDADQLRGYREADLRLCFRPCKLLVFSRTGSIIIDTSTAFHTKCTVLSKCNSPRISIQWFHIKHCSGYQYTKIQPYQSRVHFFLSFCKIRDFGSQTIYRCFT